jgi:flagellar protein FlbD
MIQLTRINHKQLVLNSDLIEHIEVTPDTIVTLVTGQKFVVLESSDEIIERILRFRRAAGCLPYISSGARRLQLCSGSGAAEREE